MSSPFIISVPESLSDRSLGPFYRGWNWRVDAPPMHVVLDFSRVNFAAPWAAALFGAYGRWLQDVHGREVDLWFDEATDVGRFLTRAGLPTLLQKAASPEPKAASLEPAGHIFPLTQIHNSNEISPCVTSLINLLAVEDRAISDAIRYSLIELLRNVVQHAACKIGAVVMGNYFPQAGQVDVVVADLGRGIKAALTERYREINDDYKAVKFALQPHVSGTFQRGAYASMASNAGLGLFFIKEIATRSSGGLFLGSGSVLADLRGTPDGSPLKRYITSRGHGWRGTLALLQLKRGNIEEFGDLLQRCREIAAEVRRDPSELKLDFIEEVPDLEGPAVIDVRDFEEDVERADSVREQEILPALESDMLVIIDFSGIRAATQSFIHALLYRVFRDGSHIETSLSIAAADRATQEAIRAVAAYARVP